MSESVKESKAITCPVGVRSEMLTDDGLELGNAGAWFVVCITMTSTVAVEVCRENCGVRYVGSVTVTLNV